MGPDFSLNFVLEAMWPIGDAAWLGPRGQLGVMAISPSGEFEDELKETKDNCKAAGVSGCDNLDGPDEGVGGSSHRRSPDHGGCSSGPWERRRSPGQRVGAEHRAA